MATNDEIRLQILERLYKHEQEKPGIFGPDRDMMLKLLRDTMRAEIAEKIMDFNMLYLDEKNLVKLQKVLGSLWFNANITSFGIDVIEHKDRYAEQFPFINVQIQNISDSMIIGNVVQAREQAKVVIQKMNNAIPQARELTKTSPGISVELKREVLKRLDVLEENIKQSDAGAIQSGWNWFQEHASWLIPILQPVISEIGKLIFS